MTTHERELDSPVDLCLPDGRSVNPDAIGWSRRPLLRANLRGGWGRTKRWDYWAILADDLVVAVTYADIDYLGLVSVEWIDLRAGEKGGREAAAPLARGVALPALPGSEPLHYRDRALSLSLVDEPGGTRIRGHWQERDDLRSELDAFVAQPEDHDSLNVVIPWSDRRFQYTSKHQARPVTGSLVRGGRSVALDGGFGVLDVGRGRWPYATRWNWGSAAGSSASGALIGLQLGGKWTVGTGATENGFLVDGRLTKIGCELDWDYDWSRPLDPWRVRAPDGSLEATLVPVYDRHVKVDALLLGTEVHQVFGSFRGFVRTDDGELHRFESLRGFAEESRSRW